MTRRTSRNSGHGLKIVLFTLMPLIQSVSTQCSSQQVITVPISNVSLSNGASTRGLSISVGNPPQPMAIQPQWFNNSWLYDQQSQCKGSESAVACITYRGGLYNEQASTSSQAVTSGPAIDNATIAQGIWYSDTINLGQNLSLPNFTFGVPRAEIGDDYETSNVLGLAPDSSLLTMLQQQHYISSKTWSMWWGQDGSTASSTHDGTFVFGGYDKSKTLGQNYTAPLNPTSACTTGINIFVNNLMLGWPNGTQTGLVSPGQGGFAACIVPDWPMALDLNVDYFEDFESFTNTESEDRSFGVDFYGMLYPSNIVYQGDLILSLSGGLDITITNSQLLHPDRTVSNTDGHLVSNASETVLLINSLQGDNQNDLPKIGRPFLTGAYLLVDHDAGTFTLWTAAPPGQDENLVQVGACSSEAVPAPAPPEPSSGISGGAIAGIGIGVVAILVIVVAAVFGFRRWKKSQQVDNSADHVPMADRKEAPLPLEPQEIGGTETAPPAYQHGETSIPGLHEMPVRRQTAEE